MNSETNRVCRDCFISTKFRNPPTLEQFYHRDGNCRTCGNKWIGINVGYHNQDTRWYEVRPRSFDSKHSLCRNHQFGAKCYRPQCRYAHNKLELQCWIEEEDLEMKRKTLSAHKISCVICRIDFKDIPNLQTHMVSNEHEIMTEGMRILRDVGSSLVYTGPIRTRPKPSFKTNTYELCKYFTRHGRCGYGAGCKNAHSEEELKVWKQAHMVEEEILLRNRERKGQRPPDSNPQSSSSYASYSASNDASNDASNSRSESVIHQSKSGACKYPSSKFEKKPVLKRKAEEYSRVTENIEGESEYVKRMYEEIDFIGIEDVINNRPDHIEILCDKDLTQTLEDSSNEFRWLLRMKSSKPDRIQGILLYDHRNVFKLGEVYKEFEGGRKNEVKFPYLPNRAYYQLHQEVTKDTYIDVVVMFKPSIGKHQVNFVVEWKDGVLVARNIRARLRGAGFREVTENFKAETQPIPKKKVSSYQDILPINWEQGYQLINAKYFQNKHKMPDNMEERVKTGFYDRINDMIVKEKYFTRFHTLLYLEEFEHKKVLSKYDLIDYKINVDTVHKEIIIDKGFDQERVETAQNNCRLIKFQLRHQLFEGYRGFRPPNIAYIIPKNTKTAYECSCIHIGFDYLVFPITMDAIRACEWNEGLAMVRFAPERDEYEKMHQALDRLEVMEALSEAILFPTLRPIRVSDQWDEDHLLNLVRFETFSIRQQEAILSIINPKYVSFPTIICGPFGCGKTKILSVAAKLIARNFHGSRILIVAKTNSCANLHVELLKRDFDTIGMLREKESKKHILFRHFARKRKLLHYDRSVKDYTNFHEGLYEVLPLHELEKCSIIVATTVGCSNLIDPKDHDNAKNIFTHIFIDEAAQLIEPEACISLSLAGLDTKIALTGDVRQSRPLILSKQGRQFHLDQSLLERFETLPEYQPDSSYQYKISLTENYRSSKEIVNFLSELFYEGSLCANPPRLQGLNFPSLSFLHVKGEEARLHGFPSFYNEEEAVVTIRVLKKFANLGMRVSRMTVVSTYRAQMKLINDALRRETTKCRDLGHFEYVTQYCQNNSCVNYCTVKVTNFDTIQGRQYDLIIVNTVRTTTNLPKDISLEERLDLGLLDDVTQFNTILTRARGWVVVIGDSDCVTNIGDCSNVWSKYLDACEGNQGFFKSLEDFEDFGDMKYEQKGKRKENESVKRPEASEMCSSVESIEDLFSPDDHNGETYQTKSNLVYSFIAACQQELIQVHANTEITAAINDQLAFAKLVLENLERQRFLEQQAILTQMQPPVRVQNPPTNVALVPDCTQVNNTQLINTSSDINQSPMQYMQPQRIVRQQLPQHRYHNSFRSK